MYGRFFVRVLLGLLVIAAVIGIGAYAYQMGLSQGAAQGASEGTAPILTGPHFYGRPIHPMGGFGCFGLLIPLFFLLLIFGGLRAMFWHGPWGHGRWHVGHPGHPGHPGWEKGVPPMFEEWHKRAHEPKPDASNEAKPA
jgi:hypothetical protein